MTATLFRHLNEQGYNSMITTGISSNVRYLLFSLSLLWSEDHAVVCFFSTSVANETENLNIWLKLNQWVKIP